ncbi:tRNA adenosine deaminase-associated protein [Trujillonella endophytica]|uniref:Putative tRNA adenosine deaminase-associated protein n=1 Tax=Trujillonella endophytica TaxID=673521 RepID=A0A1H8W299_9ACTN|nr:tRNA adenosine deaminase-associated protein [Trujillella endophytica]SEP21766.1 putative tRNA adenosine deaminase-associated protein [Trujillella endophytica]
MSAPEGPASYAVRVDRAGERWSVQLLAHDADNELPVLERALGEPGAEGWPGPLVLVVDSRLYFVVLRHGPGGMVRAFISDATMLEWLLASEVVERYGIAVDTEGTFDDDETGWPGGDLDVLADYGLPADELRPIATADDLWADEMVARIAGRLGFGDELAAAVHP